jgi:hypothetical protein
MAEVLKFHATGQASIKANVANSSSDRVAQRAHDGARTNEKVSLTELRIEKLPITGKTYYVNDAGQSGLSVRMSAGGVKAFVFTKFTHGKFTQITLGRVGAMRLDAARKAAQALHGELAMGVDVGAARRKSKLPKADTMDEAFERFLGLKTRRPATMTDYRMIWRLHVPASLKRKTVRDVTVDDIRGMKQALGSRSSHLKRSHVQRWQA